MCLLFTLHQVVPEAPLVILFNRDESYARPTLPAHFWDDCPGLLAGRDLEKGGTWGGITTDGRMAFITFVRRREPRMAHPVPRGSIVPAFLRMPVAVETFLDQLHQTRTQYLGYNLVCGDRERLFHYSNASGLVTQLTPGIHGVSNADLNTPWQKVSLGKERLGALKNQEILDSQYLFGIAEDRKRANPDDVPKDTGMSLEREWYRSSIFVDAPDYGTRSTTLIVFRADGTVHFHERTHWPESTDAEFNL